MKKIFCYLFLGSLFSFALIFTASAPAQSHEKLLHVFNGMPAEFPSSGLIADPTGNLFGHTMGAVYELVPSSSGGFRYRAIATLSNGSSDQAAGNLAMDAAGNLYGSTNEGGSNDAGYVYEVSPQGSGWTFHILYSFTLAGFGAGTVTLDASGNLYGATFFGGTFGQGVVYELSPRAEGPWAFKVLYNFTSDNGLGSLTGLTFDASGNLYGGNLTTIYKLSPNGDGTWTKSIAHTFGDAEGNSPRGDLIFDEAGNMYGTTSVGGPLFGGSAFMLSPTAGGGWSSIVLHAFGGRDDGRSPYSGLTIDTVGNLYGTTVAGGSVLDGGTVFKLTQVGGQWHEGILWRFGGAAAGDGFGPEYAVLLKSNTIYGTTGLGGDTSCNTGGGCGTIFALR